MDITLFFLVVMTFVIHMIGTLAYSVRISGTRTGTIAVSFALFNIMVLGSRTANTFQGPLLAKRVEENLVNGIISGAVTDFRLMLFAASAATIFGILITPTFQRFFTKAVEKFRAYHSFSRLFFMGFTRAGFYHIRSSIKIPSKRNFLFFRISDHIPYRYIFYNVVATAVWSTGVFSALYAGYLNPEVRVTSSQLSSVINGVATIVLLIFIDPYFSLLTDDVASNKIGQPYFRRSIIWLDLSRLAGTLLAQLLLVPAAMIIVFIAERI
ncbi:MAG: lipid II flippase Amj family protein [Deltaproteobacteria bacterium]|nr:lipid II flippase Amj family protein [Deltaproteobacteria bacterium]